MKVYFLTLFSASLIAALIGLLTPEGKDGGLLKVVKLLTSLFLVCVLISPVKSMVSGCRSLADGNFSLPGEEDSDADALRREASERLSAASKEYFVQRLTKMLEEKFSVEPGQLRCVVRFGGAEDALYPEKVTVILSGRAIWLDPEPIETYVRSLLNCVCETAIE